MREGRGGEKCEGGEGEVSSCGRSAVLFSLCEAAQ